LSLKKIFKNLQEELKTKDRIREMVLTNSREAVRVSKQAILLIHRGKQKDAEKKLKQAKEILERTIKTALPYSELISSGSLSAGYEEYAEAIALLRFVKDETFLDPKMYEIPTSSFLLGVADFIGEVRRRAIDALKFGDLKTAEKCLKVMEDVYGELVSLENVHRLVPNLRRKVDVSRKLIEMTRSDLASEVRRSLLRASLAKVEEQLKKRK
jgi:translin